jgi:hypothetical protein
MCVAASIEDVGPFGLPSGTEATTDFASKLQYSFYVVSGKGSISMPEKNKDDGILLKLVWGI